MTSALQEAEFLQNPVSLTLGEYKREWHKYDEKMRKDSVMSPLIGVYYQNSKHSPIPIILPTAFYDCANRASALLAPLLQKIVYDYMNGMPELVKTIHISARVARILRSCPSSFPLGSFRPDILLPNPLHHPQAIRICEINARFALNGFLYGFQLFKGTTYHNDKSRKYALRNLIPSILLQFDITKEIIILKGREKGYGAQIFASYMKVYFPSVSFRFVLPEEVSLHEKGLKDSKGFFSQIILELHQDEIEALPHDIVICIASKCTCINDLRSIFLLHDKRLLSLLCDTSFLERYLSPEDALFLSECITPTWVLGIHKGKVQEAKENREDFILKPNDLGKGELTYIGSELTKKEWISLLEQDAHLDYIIQKFIPSTLQIHEKVDVLCVDDSRDKECIPSVHWNVVGMLLLHNFEFFGFGFFRASPNKICALSRDGYSFVGGVYVEEGKEVHMCKESELLLDLSISLWKHVVPHSLDVKPCPIFIPWSEEHFQYVYGTVAQFMSKSGVFGSKHTVLCLYDQPYITRIFKNIFSNLNMTFLPYGMNEVGRMKTLCDAFDDLIILGTLHDIIEIATRLKEERIHLNGVKRICVGQNGEQLQTLSVAHVALFLEVFYCDSVSFLLGSSVIGFWAVKKEYSDEHFVCCSKMFSLSLSAHSSQLILTENHPHNPVEKCLMDSFPSLRFLRSGLDDNNTYYFSFDE